VANLYDKYNQPDILNACDDAPVTHTIFPELAQGFTL